MVLHFFYLVTKCKEGASLTKRRTFHAHHQQMSKDVTPKSKDMTSFYGRSVDSEREKSSVFQAKRIQVKLILKFEILRYTSLVFMMLFFT